MFLLWPSSSLFGHIRVHYLYINAEISSHWLFVNTLLALSPDSAIVEDQTAAPGNLKISQQLELATYILLYSYLPLDKKNFAYSTIFALTMPRALNT